MTKLPRVFFVGNKKSLLFCQRLEKICDLAKLHNVMVINTSKNSIKEIFSYFLKTSILFLLSIFSFQKLKLIFHGASSSILWLIPLMPRVETISILQGSELEKDFIGLRRILIKIILSKSSLIICRNKSQLKNVTKLTRVRSDTCQIVKWGLDKTLFQPMPKRSGETINIISPRASQSEYNIPIIIETIQKLKSEGLSINFCYIDFNRNIEMTHNHEIDEKLINPIQSVLWKKISESDIVISIPDYDGLSNTLLESLALGAFIISSDLDAYKFFNDEKYLGSLIKIEDDKQKTSQNLYSSIKLCLSDIKKIRATVDKRRLFVKNNYFECFGLERLINLLKE